VKSALLALLLCGTCWAGFCTVGSEVDQKRHDFEFFGGYSPGTTTLIGTATDRQFVVAGFSYGYRCWAWDHASISYDAGVMPAAILIEPTHSVYGVAITPLGFTLEFRPRGRLHPFAELVGGLIASTEPIPYTGPDATGLNFLFDLGGGLRWDLSETRAITVGYKYLHISNAFTTDFNPGIDNNIIFIGYSFLR